MKPHAKINNTLTGQIITLVCEVWGVSRGDLVGKSRRRPLPWARSQLCCYLRLYAGHDSISCAALLHHSENTVHDYNHHYQYLIRTYRPFADHDKLIKEKVKALVKNDQTLSERIKKITNQ